MVLMHHHPTAAFQFTSSSGGQGQSLLHQRFDQLGFGHYGGQMFGEL